MDNKNKISWSFLFIGAGFLIWGIVMVHQGSEAYKAGAIVPAQGKTPAMTGVQAIATGAGMALCGVGFLINEVRKIFTRK
jgi:hypothetical protein